MGENSTMKTGFWLDQIPLWGVFLLTVAVVLLSVGIGTFMGSRKRRQPDHEREAPFGTIISATLGLLAFMLAFTFGIAAERLQTRMQLLLDEVNSIGTTYLRAGMLLEPHRRDIRRLLREYVDIRARLAKEDLSRQLKMLQEALSRSEQLHDEMWLHAVAMAKADPHSEIDALFISSLNEMIDLHNSRATVIRYRIPTTLWNVLYFVTILSMVTVGYQAGLSGKSSLKIGLVLALTFSTVVFLIADLDRVTEGNLRVNQQPLLDLQEKMQAPEAEAGYEQAFPERDEPTNATCKNAMVEATSFPGAVRDNEKGSGTATKLWSRANPLL
jgi:hypothetical protein